MKMISLMSLGNFAKSLNCKMSTLRNQKILNKNNIPKTRVKNNRTSKDVFEFYPVDIIIYEKLPTKENVLNYFFYEQIQNKCRNELVSKIAKQGKIYKRK